MAVTAASLAAVLGIPVADADDDTDTGIVEAGRLLSIATSLVTSYLRGAADCPVDIQDEAVIRTAGHVQNRLAFGVGEDARLKAAGVQFWNVTGAASAVRRSGAGALLAPWVKRTA